MHDVLPGPHILVKILDFSAPVRAVGPQHRGGGEGEQYGGGGDLGHVEALALKAAAGQVLRRHVGGELVHIGPDAGFAGVLVQLVPVGQLQHRDIHRPADVELDAFRLGAAVGQV